MKNSPHSQPGWPSSDTTPRNASRVEFGLKKQNSAQQPLEIALSAPGQGERESWELCTPILPLPSKLSVPGGLALEFLSFHLFHVSHIKFPLQDSPPAKRKAASCVYSCFLILFFLLNALVKCKTRLWEGPVGVWGSLKCNNCRFLERFVQYLEY